MLYFALVIVIYWLLVYRFFDQSVAPLGKKIGTDFIPFPKRAVKAWIAVATALFSTTAFMNARESNWKLQESMGALSVLLGIFLGLIAKVEQT
ncbi:unnamed protein product [Ectocarpus sp. 6 AP-2014]